MARLTFSFNSIDQISIGLHMAYGNDENGEFHITALGFLFFEVSLVYYYNQL